jgi:hypothetical protein
MVVPHPVPQHAGCSAHCFWELRRYMLGLWKIRSSTPIFLACSSHRATAVAAAGRKRTQMAG